MLENYDFLRDFLPVFLGVILSFSLWFGSERLIRHKREQKVKTALLKDLREEIGFNKGVLDALDKEIPQMYAKGEVMGYIPYRMKVEVCNYLVESGEIRLIKDWEKQGMIRAMKLLCSSFNDLIGNTEVLLLTLTGKGDAVRITEPDALRLAKRRFDGLAEQARENKGILEKWRIQLQDEAPTKENKTHDNLMRNFVVSQVPIYFFASLLVLQQAGLVQKGEASGFPFLPYWTYIVFGFILLGWAFTLCVDAWRGQRIFRRLARMTELPYWVISTALFVISLATNLIAVLKTGIGDVYFHIFYFAGVALLILLLVHFIQSSREK